MKILSALIAVFITVPIGIYLQYMILKMLPATELMWFLFWVYVPFGLLVAVVQRLMEDKK